MRSRDACDDMISNRINNRNADRRRNTCGIGIRVSGVAVMLKLTIARRFTINRHTRASARSHLNRSFGE